MRARGLAALLLAVAATGCATRKDLRLLRTEVEAMRATNEELLREIQQQNRALADSLGTIAQQNLRTRGDLMNRLNQVDRQLIQVQEQTGQGQQRLAELREQLRRQEEAQRRAAAAAADTAPAPQPPPSAEEIFNAAAASLQRGSATAARAGFEELLTTYPEHGLAPEAQFFLGDALAAAREPDAAVAAYKRVVERFPTSPRAPTALLKAGLLELERGNKERARPLFSQVVQAYGKSKEAVAAREQLQKLGARR